MKQLKNIPAMRKSIIRRFIVVGILGVLFMAGLTFIINNQPARLPHSTKVDVESQTRLQAKTQVIATMDDRSDIMAQFVCNCGTCKIIDDLRDCNCGHLGGAREVKQFIDDRIHDGKYSAMQIVVQVAAKYGGKKI